MKNKKNRHASVRNILIPDIVAIEKKVMLSSDLKKHFIKVLRMQSGSELNILDGKGNVYAGFLSDVENGTVDITETLKQINSEPSIELCIALPKSDSMEWVVEKATECGVSSIQAIETSRSVVRLDSKDIDKYQIRWQKIADESLMQSERVFRVDVKSPMKWKDWLRANLDQASFVFVSESRNEKNTSESIRDLFKKLNLINKKPIRFLIGPEGGFSNVERDELKSLGFQELSLGETVYRTETAVVVALTMIQISRSL